MLGTLVTGAVWWVHQPLLEISHFQVSEIQVRGNSHVTPEEVRSQLGLQAPVNVFQLDLKELAGRIMAHPWIRNASIQRRLPLGLIVTVEERQPVGLLLTGKTYLLSADGFILDEVKGRPPRALPRIRPGRRVTCRVGQHLDDPHLLGGLQLLAVLREARVLRQLRVEQVAVTADGTYTVRLAQGRPILRVGPAAEPRRQLIRLDTALRHRGQELESFAYVDLRFPGRVILKPWRKEGEKWGGRTT
ncbi:MAG: cell division protein FtsQ/DivIB [Candidatus Methylomirabilales bacterium]